MSTGEVDLADLEKRMEGALSALKTEFSGLRNSWGWRA